MAALAVGALAAALASVGCGPNSGAAAASSARAAASPSATSSTTSTHHASADGPCGGSRRPPAHYAHVVWVVLENHAYGSVIGSHDAPYENRLAAQCASASNFSGDAYPSLPNYLAMTSGSTHGITDDGPPSSHRLTGPSIFSQLGRQWRALQESMRSNCALTDSGDYAVKHNPAAYFTSVRKSCASQDVPLGDAPDLSAKFTFVTPNLCNDTHDCSVSTGDRWLRTFLGKVFASPEYRGGRTAVFLTWDTDDSRHSNHVATLVAAPSVVPGRVSSRPFNHYSMLRTTEEMLGLGFVGKAATATTMRDALGI